MLCLAEKVHHTFLCFTKDIHQSIKKAEENIHSVSSDGETKSQSKRLKLSYHGHSLMIHEFSFLISLLQLLVASVCSCASETRTTVHKLGLSRSWIKSRVVDKLGDVYGVVIVQIKTMMTEIENYETSSTLPCCNQFFKEVYCVLESIKTQMEIHEKDSTLPLLESCRAEDLMVWLDKMLSQLQNIFSDFCNEVRVYFESKGNEMLSFDLELDGNEMWSYDMELDLAHSLIGHEFLLLSNLSELAAKICQNFASFAGEIKSMKTESPIWHESSTVYDLLKMIYVAEKIHHSFCSFVQEFQSIHPKMIIRENRLHKWFGTSITNDHFGLLFRLHQIVDLAEKIDNSFGGFKQETDSIMTQIICKKRQLEFRTLEGMCHDFSRVTDEIESIKTQMAQIYDEKKIMYEHGVHQITRASGEASSIVTNSVVEDEAVVGFSDEKTTIIDLLTGEHGKQLKLIQIVGMPGLGKTTLARKVYDNSFTQHHFYVQAWTKVSQLYRKRNVLLGILCSGFKLDDEICNMSNEMLGGELYRRLKGKRYLIVMDDIWEVEVWDDLKIYFPNDNNGSRIMFTSRLAVLDVAKAHHLRFLNEDESWTLLQQKVFGKGSCPLQLMEIGKQISKKCGGLPLAIVVLSGLLVKNEKTQQWWRHVAQSVSSYIASDQERYMDTLALSYNHLPDHLKACFLYFGAFPGDYEIPVWKLFWLWIAEGFIYKNQQKRMEEVAEGYLMELVGRNLIIISKKRSNGGIKACYVHDLLRDLCLKKAQEENFLCLEKAQEENFLDLSRYVRIPFSSSLSSSSSSSSSSSPLENKQRRICIHSNTYSPSLWLYHGLCVRSFLSFGHSLADLSVMDVSIVCQGFELLRVLDLSSVKILTLPVEMTYLLQLKYLALHVGDLEYFKPSISDLENLETLIVDGGPISLLVLNDFWKLKNLRHLYAKLLIEIPDGSDDGRPLVLNKLQSIGKLDLRGLNEQILQQIPYLRKLKCSFMESWGESHIFPELHFLIHLETLNVIYNGDRTFPGNFPHLAEFPPNLKILTLSNFRLPWEEMSTLGKLPNLEILKLSYKAFDGPRWNTCDGEFLKLKFLKFRGLDIKKWNAFGSHFPSLRTLVLDDCKQLEEIPSSLGDNFTLEVIQLWYCNASVVKSARHIEKLQLSMGNDEFKIIVHPNHYNESEDEYEEEVSMYKYDDEDAEEACEDEEYDSDDDTDDGDEVYMNEEYDDDDAS